MSRRIRNVRPWPLGCRRGLCLALTLQALGGSVTGCTTLGGTVDRDARTVTWRCDGNVKVSMQTHAVVVTCPAGPSPTITVQTPGPVDK